MFIVHFPLALMYIAPIAM